MQSARALQSAAPLVVAQLAVQALPVHEHEASAMQLLLSLWAYLH
jgi:hypothetical protein